MKIFRDIAHMWVHMYRNSKSMFWIGFVGVLTSMTAALVLNITANDPNMWFVLIMYTFGSVAMGITSYINKDSWMLILMIFYTIMNVIGMTNLVIGA